MGYGLKVFHPSGQSQIDNDFQNFRYIASESDSVTRGYNWVSTNIDDLLQPKPAPIYRETPFLATKADPTYFHYPGTLDYNSPTGDQFRIYSEGSHTLYSGFWGVGFDDIGSYGMQVRNPKGETVFDSSMAWMKIIKVYADSADEFTTNNHTVVDAVNNYFYLSNGSTIRDGFTINNWTARGFKRTSSTNIRVAPFEYVTEQSGDPTWDRWEDDYTLIEIAAPQ